MVAKRTAGSSDKLSGGVNVAPEQVSLTQRRRES